MPPNPTRISSAMATLAFTAALPLTSSPTFSGRAVTSRPPTAIGALRMSLSAADKFMFTSQKYEAKQAAAPFGEYTVQCTEGSGGANTAEATRLASLAASFRLRQASASARYADLYATRRAAIISAAGSHVAEGYAVRFPARASASVLGRAEALRACSRYFQEEDDVVGEYMFQCVDRQYKTMKIPYGEYNTMCADGRCAGEAETARVAGLATEFRAGQMGAGVKMQMRYDASREAMFSGRGCDYEEKQYAEYPKMAAGIRWGTGAYAASVRGVMGVMGGKMATVTEQVLGVNLDSYWPSNKIRPAVERKSAPWMPSPIKSYAAMSEAAVAYGVEAQTKPFVESGYEGWSSGWKPESSIGYK